jgi:hypothetical protein
MACLITKHCPPRPPHLRRIRVPPFTEFDFDDDDDDTADLLNPP